MGGKYQVFTAEILIRPSTKDEAVTCDKATRKSGSLVCSLEAKV